MNDTGPPSHALNSWWFTTSTHLAYCNHEQIAESNDPQQTKFAIEWEAESLMPTYGEHHRPRMGLELTPPLPVHCFFRSTLPLYNQLYCKAEELTRTSIRTSSCVVKVSFSSTNVTSQLYEPSHNVLLIENPSALPEQEQGYIHKSFIVLVLS